MESQAIVNTMEVLETRPVNELVTEATIKVCYVSESPNQNNTVINKEVGRQIAATLPGAPVVGFFDESTGDFEQHSRRVTIKDGVVNIRDITKPYGFVSFDKPWYQDFMEDGQVRTYLMCKAYLWTRQYEEASLALGKGQSMELDEASMSGYYEGDVFVFTNATLDKLCILGDAYAPCFEGAKIMSSYTKQYESLAEQVENILGRRYYVMNGQLEPKPEKITLDYALQLGWNLNDAVYMQLAARGADTKYGIEGIYTEAGEIFVILQDRESLEYVRVSLEITGQDTVVLGTEMTAVQQSWTIKPPADPEPVEPLGGTTVTATTTPATNTAAATPDPAPAAVEPGPAPAGSGVFKKKDDENDDGEKEPKDGEGTSDDPKEGDDPDADPNDDDEKKKKKAQNAKCGGGSGDDKKKKKKTYAADGTLISEGDEGEPAEPATEPAGVPDPAIGNPDPSDTAGAATYAADGNDGGEPQSTEPNAEPAASSYSASGEGTEPTAEPVEPATDYKALAEELQAKVNTLTEELDVYRQKDAAEEGAKKQAMVTSYAKLLTEEEMKSVVDKLDEYSVDEVEAKLAVTYARKQKQNADAQPAGFQLNIHSTGAENFDGIPNFMLQAMELERERQLSI